jgi:hypothetical protein
MKTIEEIISDIGSRFKSGNDIPVERTHITRTEWLAVCDELDRLQIEINDLYEMQEYE